MTWWNLIWNTIKTKGLAWLHAVGLYLAGDLQTAGKKVAKTLEDILPTPETISESYKNMKEWWNQQKAEGKSTMQILGDLFFKAMDLAMQKFNKIWKWSWRSMRFKSAEEDLNDQIKGPKSWDTGVLGNVTTTAGLLGKTTSTLMGDTRVVQEGGLSKLDPAWLKKIVLGISKQTNESGQEERDYLKTLVLNSKESGDRMADMLRKTNEYSTKMIEKYEFAEIDGKRTRVMEEGAWRKEKKDMEMSWDSDLWGKAKALFIANVDQEDDPKEKGEKGSWWPYAKGGIVTKPTRALIGEAGPEMVIPRER